MRIRQGRKTEILEDKNGKDVIYKKKKKKTRNEERNKERKNEKICESKNTK